MKQACFFRLGQGEIYDIESWMANSNCDMNLNQRE